VQGHIAQVIPLPGAKTISPWRLYLERLAEENEARVDAKEARCSPDREWMEGIFQRVRDRENGAL
jgi:hypothetical protein